MQMNHLEHLLKISLHGIKVCHPVGLTGVQGDFKLLPLVRLLPDTQFIIMVAMLLNILLLFRSICCVWLPLLVHHLIFMDRQLEL
jgi:hypothetical protein